jgi:nitrate/TMAO reductase-like tetraheme cytochrome c subunit
MLLIKFLFHVQISKLEKMLTQVEDELKGIKEETRKKEATTKELEKRPKETSKDMVARWMKDASQDCSNDTMKK